MIWVTLTDEQVRRAIGVGLRRRLTMLNRPDAHGFDYKSWARWGNDIEGAAAEYAYALHRGLEWNALPGPEAMHNGDVGHAEVRATEHLYGGLVLHDSDPDDAPFVLVVGSLPTFHIVGGMRARDGKHKEFWKPRWERPAYCVPQRYMKEEV